jgi:iron complex outermembrane receptor protein
MRYQSGPIRASFGMDWQSSEFQSLRGNAVGVINQRIDLDRRSLGLYAQAGWDIRPDLSLSLGGRRQNVDQGITRAASQLDNDQSKTAWDLGFSHDLSDGWRFFGKAGHTFRFPKVDDLTTFAGLGIDLKPEHGDHADLGMEWKQSGRRLQATLYNLRLRDEIAWNINQNENLDATRHRGLELDGRLDLSPVWSLAANYAYTDAQFSAGANQGREIPLVSRHQGRIGLEWRGETLRGNLEVRAQGSRHYGGDYDNSIAPQPGHAVWNLALEKQFGAWQARLTSHNLLNRKYASVAYEDGWTAPHSLYPGEGRSWFLSLGWKG